MSIYLIHQTNGNILHIEDSKFLTAMINFYEDDLDHANIYVCNEIEQVKFIPCPDVWYMTDDLAIYGVSYLMEEKLFISNDNVQRVSFLTSQPDPKTRGTGYRYNLENLRGNMMKICITADQFNAIDRINGFTGWELDIVSENQGDVVDFTS